MEVGIERCVVLVPGMEVAARGVALPHLQQRVAHRLAVLVDHPAAHHDALTERLGARLPRQIHVVRLEDRARKLRHAELGRPLLERHQRLQRRARRGALVVRIQVRRMGAGGYRAQVDWDDIGLLSC